MAKMTSKPKERIEKGDLVDVFFSGGTSFRNALVLYVACADGDAWHLRTKDGRIVYVQHYETMIQCYQPPSLDL